MAIRGCVITVAGTGILSSAASGQADIDAIQAGSLATLTTDVAAAQVVGAGDAHVEIDAIDADVVALTAALAAHEAAAAGNVVVQVDTAVTRNQLRVALDKAFDYFVKSAGIIT